MQMLEILSQLPSDQYQPEVTRLMDAFDLQAEAVYFIRVLIAFVLGCIIGLCHDRKKVGVGKEGATVRGLSTAATIWATAAIGLSSGAGMYFIAVAGALVIALFHYFSKFHTAVD